MIWETNKRSPTGPVRAARPRLPARGLRLGSYDLVQPIARGGMAEVWLARRVGELGFSRAVALKTIRPEFASEPSFREMFLNEARLAARIRHGNVIEVFDLGEEDGVVYLAMTLVEGDSVYGLLRRQSQRRQMGMPVPIALRVMADILEGLHAAHELTDEDGSPLHVVHRDISPHNILVGLDGVAKLSDFGIAKALARYSQDTGVGLVKGKYCYFSPEQIARIPPDRRSDLFAAGAVLWEMLTGLRLFNGEDIAETLGLIMSMPIPDPQMFVPSLPPIVSDVVLRALDRAAEKRFATAAQMADALETVARLANARASTKDVAAFVSELAGPDVEQLRLALRDASRLSTDAMGPQSSPAGRQPPPIEPMDVASPPSIGSLATTVVRSPSKGQSLAIALVVAATLATAAAIALVLGLARPSRGGSTEMASPAPLAPPPASLASPPASAALAPVASAAPPSTAATEAAAVASAAPGPSVDPPAAASRAHSTRRGANDTSSRPKFGSPYGP